MTKSPDHFRVSDLIVALKALGWESAVDELNDLESQIRSLNTKRRELANDRLQDVIYAVSTGQTRFKFRPCHNRRLDNLEVSTDFWLV